MMVCFLSARAGITPARETSHRALSAVFLSEALSVIRGEHHDITSWCSVEKGAPNKTGTRIGCWHGFSGYKNQTRRDLIIGRRDAILRGATQLRSLIVIAFRSRFRSRLP